jgi:hypothetical protein
MSFPAGEGIHLSDWRGDSLVRPWRPTPGHTEHLDEVAARLALGGFDAELKWQDAEERGCLSPFACHSSFTSSTPTSR